MPDPTDPADDTADVLDATLANIAGAITAHHDLLRGARQLRLMTANPRAATALTALLRVPALEEMHLSWNLLGAVSDGGFPEVAAAFLELVGMTELALFTWALLGLAPGDVLATRPSP